MERPVLYNLSELNHDEGVPHWDILGFFRKKDGSVWVEFSYCGKVRRKKCINLGGLYKGQYPEFMDRYRICLTWNQVREFGFEPGTLNGLAVFDVTPIPGDNSDIPLPPVRDLSV